MGSLFRWVQVAPAATMENIVMLEFCRERCLVCIFSFLMAVTGAAHASVLEFHADLSGACAATGSPGTGTGTFTLDTDTGLFEWVIVISGTAPEWAAHIHGPISPGCGAMGMGDAFITLPTGSPKIGSATLTPQQQQDLFDGLFYVNIHTDGFDQGEISGEIEGPPVPAISTWGMIALALLVLTVATISIRYRIKSLST